MTRLLSSVDLIGAGSIFRKELRTQMRSRRSALSITLLLTTIGLVAYGAVRSASAANSGDALVPTIGTGILRSMAYAELAFLLLAVPALTAAGISGERDRRTLDLLMCSRATPAVILLAKLAASVAFVGLLLVMALPLFAVVSVFGGLDLAGLATICIVGMMTAVVVASLSLLCSTLARRGVTAMVASYAITALLLLVPLVLPHMTTTPQISNPSPYPVAYQLVDPFIALSASLPPGALPSDADPITALINPADSAGASGPGPGQVRLAGDRVVEGPFTNWHVWQVFSLLSLVVGGIALGAATVALGGLERGRGAGARVVARLAQPTRTVGRGRR